MQEIWNAGFVVYGARCPLGMGPDDLLDAIDDLSPQVQTVLLISIANHLHEAVDKGRIGTMVLPQAAGHLMMLAGAGVLSLDSKPTAPAEYEPQAADWADVRLTGTERALEPLIEATNQNGSAPRES